MDIIKGLRHTSGALLFAVMVWLLIAGPSFLFDQAPGKAGIAVHQEAAR
jgi:hypothetical protein